MSTNCRQLPKRYAILSSALLICMVGTQAFAAATNKSGVSPTDRAINTREMRVASLITTGVGRHIVVLRTVRGPEAYLPILLDEVMAASLRKRLEKGAQAPMANGSLLSALLSQNDLLPRQILLKGGDDEGAMDAVMTFIAAAGETRLSADPAEAVALSVSWDVPVFVEVSARLQLKSLEEAMPNLPKDKGGSQLSQRQGPSHELYSGSL